VLPFSLQLGLINAGSHDLTARLVPAMLLGLWSGKRIVARVPAHVFQNLVLALSAASAAWLLVRSESRANAAGVHRAREERPRRRGVAGHGRIPSWPRHAAPPTAAPPGRSSTP
jgi:ABC-type nickel/cobalt efflux system permease component RcnA